MTLQEKIKKDMVQAMRDHETEKLNLLRVIIGEINRIDKNVSDDETIKVIRKMHENAKEQNNSLEMEVLGQYLPKMYSEEQIRVLVANIIKGNYLKGARDIGKVMSILSKHPDKALIDNKVASQFAKELLNK